MPFALIFALVGSLAVHGAALFGTEVDLFGHAPEPVPLLAEIQPPPAPPVAPPKRSKPVKAAAPAAVKAAGGESPVPADLPQEIAPESPSTAAVIPAEPVKAVLPASGSIRYAIFRGPVSTSRGLRNGLCQETWYRRSHS